VTLNSKDKAGNGHVICPSHTHTVAELLQIKHKIENSTTARNDLYTVVRQVSALIRTAVKWKILGTLKLHSKNLIRQFF
jgi:hypothetical protein